MPVLIRVMTLVSALSLAVALPMPTTSALETGRPGDPYPLKPADTSSPRDTLHSFLTNAQEFVQSWRQDEFNQQAARAYGRAVETLDLSSTPHSDAWMVRSDRVLLLKEILDRIQLPPGDAIPGDSEVAAGDLTRWIIPDTRIIIERVERGPRAGEFLFSAETVQQLHRSYEHARHLPYKTGATTGIYDQWNSSQRTDLARERQIRNRLKPVDTSNPRSTLDGFLESINRAHKLAMQASADLKAVPPRITTAEARHIDQAATNLLQRAITTLDLSQVPEALREDTGIETALQLKEIFDRMRLPAVATVPNAQMVAAARQTAGGSPVTSDDAIRWRYPNTAIEIVEIMEGERRGQFLFSADSVRRAGEYYQEVHDLPYRKGIKSKGFTSTDKSEGFYHYYISTPGYLVAYAHPLGRLVDALPDGFKQMYGGQALWQWLGLLTAVLLFLLMAFIVHRLISRAKRRVHSPAHDWLIILSPVTIAVIAITLGEFIDDDLNITGNVLAVVSTVGTGVVIAMAAWSIFYLCKAIAETVVALPRIHDESIDATLLRLAARIIGVLLGAWILIQGIHGLGVNIVPLVAGLGVGGLAVALAARSTLENVIGSFMIFADRPYRIGQRVNVMGQDGVVESIGLRSTKIRLLNGHLTTIPNEKMAAVEIENIGRRPYIRRNLNVTVTYDTPPEKINRAVEILRDILSVPDTADGDTLSSSAALAQERASSDGSTVAAHPNEAINQPGFPPRVYFNDLKSDSLNILAIYWFHPPDYWNYLEHAHWVNVQIMERFNAEGIDFAFPTQTLHLAGDDKRPLTVGQRWVAKDEEISHSAILAQAAALGAQTVLGNRVPASESVRPQPGKKTSKPLVEDELTDAPLEEELLHGDANADDGSPNGDIQGR